MRFEQRGEETVPYIEMRHGLEAKVDRKSFYRLIELGRTQAVQGTNMFGLDSGGVFFPIMDAELMGL